MAPWMVANGSPDPVPRASQRHDLGTTAILGGYIRSVSGSGRPPFCVMGPQARGCFPPSSPDCVEDSGPCRVTAASPQMNQAHTPCQNKYRARRNDIT
jgi:hypothetical protein